MQIEEVKRNLNKKVRYGEKSGYTLTACILRKSEKGFFYQAEILDDQHGKSVVICKLEDVRGESE